MAEFGKFGDAVPVCRKSTSLFVISASISYFNKKNRQMMTPMLQPVNHHYVTYRYLNSACFGGVKFNKEAKMFGVDLCIG